MRRSVTLLVLVLLLIFPALTYAQTSVVFDKLDIQFWPEYDQPAVLVIYDFVLSADTSLPALVSVRMPLGAQLSAVAREENGGLMNVEHALPVQIGNFSVVSFSVTDRSAYRVEFYIPYVRQDKMRTFAYTWPGDYALFKLNVWMQEPVGATNVKTEPAMTSTGPRQDGFSYQTLALENVELGESLSFKFTYDKDSEALSAASRGAQPSEPLEQPQQFMSLLPWILGGIGVALIVGGGVWYWMTGRSSSGAGRSRRRHASQVEEAAGSAVYCSQCGKRAQSNDRFCRACGSKLRSAE